MVKGISSEVSSVNDIGGGSRFHRRSGSRDWRSIVTVLLWSGDI